jgi:hypothetical protein
MFAISGTKGSSGFGSVSNEDILKSTKNNIFILKPLLIVKAGDH